MGGVRLHLRSRRFRQLPMRQPKRLGHSLFPSQPPLFRVPNHPPEKADQIQYLRKRGEKGQDGGDHGTFAPVRPETVGTSARIAVSTLTLFVPHFT